MYIFVIISKMEHFGEKCMRETMFPLVQAIQILLMLKTAESPCIQGLPLLPLKMISKMF